MTLYYQQPIKQVQLSIKILTRLRVIMQLTLQNEQSINFFLEIVLAENKIGDLNPLFIIFSDTSEQKSS